MGTALTKQLIKSGVTAWKNAGYNGSGIVIWDAESSTSDHGQATRNTIINISSAITVINAPISGSISLGYSVTYNGVTYTPETFINTFNVKIVTRSIAGTASTSGAEHDYWLNIRNVCNIIMNNSGGNDGAEGASSAFPANVAFLWGAVGINDNGVIVKKTYSSIDELIFACNFTGDHEGTSFASPWSAAEEAMIIARFGDMTHLEMETFLGMICKNMVYSGENPITGEDDYTGLGVVLLPLPTKKFISMTIGSTSYKVDGISQTMDTSPVLSNGNTFVPIRAISESLGKTITPVTNANGSITITITGGGSTVIITTGSVTMMVNGVVKTLTVAPYIDINNRTLVPVRAVSEAFGCGVGWTQSTQKVFILEK